MELTFDQGELNHADVQDLLQFHVAAMRGQSPPEACHVLPASGLADPSITFFTARCDGELVGVGALKANGDGTGELKSMRVAPSFAGRGAGRAMLETLIGEARKRGYRTLLLETGRSDEFAAASRLYDRAGFTERGPFSDYQPTDFTRFMQLVL